MKIGFVILTLFLMRYLAQAVFSVSPNDIRWGWFGVIWCAAWLGVLAIVRALTNKKKAAAD